MPVPVPSDLVMLLLGERVSAGALPLWLAVVLLELVAVVVRRRRGRVARVMVEGACPACLALGLGRDAPNPPQGAPDPNPPDCGAPAGRVAQAGTGCRRLSTGPGQRPSRS